MRKSSRIVDVYFRQNMIEIIILRSIYISRQHSRVTSPTLNPVAAADVGVGLHLCATADAELRSTQATQMTRDTQTDGRTDVG